MSLRELAIYLAGVVTGVVIPVVVVLRLTFPAFITLRHWREFVADFWHVWRRRRRSAQ